MLRHVTSRYTSRSSRVLMVKLDKVYRPGQGLIETGSAAEERLASLREKARERAKRYRDGVRDKLARLKELEK